MHIIFLLFFTCMPICLSLSCRLSQASDWTDVMIINMSRKITGVYTHTVCVCVCFRLPVVNLSVQLTIIHLNLACPGVLVVVFGLCWAPFHVDRLLWSYIDLSSEHHLKVFEHVHIISGVCFYLSSAINPILYNLMSTKFREMFSHVTCYSESWPIRSSLQMTQRSTMSEKSPSNSKWTGPNEVYTQKGDT